jgi:Na+/melibiose symporter-like transporter
MKLVPKIGTKFGGGFMGFYLLLLGFTKFTKTEKAPESTLWGFFKHGENG